MFQQIKKRILVGLTGKNSRQIEQKISDCEKLKIKRVSLFLEFVSIKQRKEIYSILLSSKIKKIPFVHARHDMTHDEYKFLVKNFKTKYFNLHETGFKYLPKSFGFHKKNVNRI